MEKEIKPHPNYYQIEGKMLGDVEKEFGISVNTGFAVIMNYHTLIDYYKKHYGEQFLDNLDKEDICGYLDLMDYIKNYWLQPIDGVGATLGYRDTFRELQRVNYEYKTNPENYKSLCYFHVKDRNCAENIKKFNITESDYLQTVNEHQSIINRLRDKYGQEFIDILVKEDLFDYIDIPYKRKALGSRWEMNDERIL